MSIWYSGLLVLWDGKSLSKVSIVREKIKTTRSIVLTNNAIGDEALYSSFTSYCLCFTVNLNSNHRPHRYQW